MIDGKTKLIAHLGYPTESFKAPMIYNPWFESRGIDAEAAVSMIINGFVRDVFIHLPMEFAVEASKLLGLKLEGTVG